MVAALQLVLAAAAGAAAGSLLACLPSLHVYNVMGLAVLGLHAAGLAGHLPPEWLIGVSAGLMVGYATLNTLPSVLLAAPDESAMFTVLPGQKYMLQGRGYEAVMLTTAGGTLALVALLVLVAPLAPVVLPRLSDVLQGHTHWILWCVIAFMLMSEWPKGGRLGRSHWAKFLDSWKSTGAGLATFLLAGLLGFVLLYRSPIAPRVAFQNLMPAFVGLFAVPWLVVNLSTGLRMPPQTLAVSGRLSADELVRGTFAGGLGGGFAAYFPVVTGGVGGLLAGHATALRNDRVFLVSQGASKLVYYVGALLLFSVPGLHLKRGGGAAMLGGLYQPRTGHDYYAMLAGIAVAGVVSLLLVGPLARLVLAAAGRWGYRRLSAAALVVILGLAVAITGLTGLLVLVTGAGIGLVPVLFGSRRMNCLGVILLPMACNMSGVGPAVASGLGLM